jgi:hypothetical protein
LSLLNFRDVVAERTACLVPLGFTERQARFLTTVMAHSGVFLERQYCRFAGIAHGQKSHDFIDRLVQRGFARVEATGHRYQGRFYHLHHKRLYSLIGQTDNRNRKRAHRSRMIERLMLLDVVLDDRDVLWLGTESDKARYFQERLAQYRMQPNELPHLAFGSGPTQTLRLFADKLPIGVDALSDRYVFTYLITRSSPLEFRSYLMRHYSLMRLLLRWTLRVYVPRKFEKAIPGFRRAVKEEFRRPLRPSDGEELLWFFRQRQEAARQPAFVPDARYLEAARQFSAPRFGVLEKVWRLHGDDVIWNVYSKGIEDQFDIGRAAVEFIVLSRQYLHLAHLVGVA